MLQWILMLEKARKNEKARAALADPLDGEDWRGLGWLVNMMVAMSRYPRWHGVHNGGRARVAAAQGLLARTSP